MSKFIGRTVDVGIAKESVRGTAETAAAFWTPKLELSVDDTIEQAIDESSMGVIEDSPNAVVVGKSAEGEITGNILDKSFGLLLLATLGTDTVSGPSQSTVYTHTFSVAQSAQHQSLTIFQEDANQDYKYALGVATSLEIDIALKKYATYKWGFRSKAGATATLTPSYSAENHFLPQHGSLKIASAIAGLGAASVIPVRKVNLKISTNAEDDRKIGSTDPADILNKQFQVEFSIELVYNDETFKTQMNADTAQAMRIDLTNTDVTIGTSLNPQLTIDLAKAKFSKFTRNYSNDDIVTVTVEGKAHYSLTDTSMISIVLKNTQSSY